jgi:hypothetical protein
LKELYHETIEITGPGEHALKAFRPPVQFALGREMEGGAVEVYKPGAWIPATKPPFKEDDYVEYVNLDKEGLFKSSTLEPGVYDFILTPGYSDNGPNVTRVLAGVTVPAANSSAAIPALTAKTHGTTLRAGRD